MPSGRKVLGQTATLGLGAFAAPHASSSEGTSTVSGTEISTLCGKWLFGTDPQNSGSQENWIESGGVACGR